MTTSKRLADRKTAKFHKNVFRRGAVPETIQKKETKYPVAPWVIGLFVFVVVGSALVQIIRTAQTPVVG
eukprot:SM000027S09714  [mRNA]  locus=s27:981976:982527:- [translate_table: standard]